MRFYPQTILLASGSPRRRELLTQAGFRFRVVPPDIDEEQTAGRPLREIPEWLASEKAKACSHLQQAGEIILACDTVVLLNDHIYGKPRGREEAIRMLQDLSGCRHEVISGVCLLRGNQSHHFSETTRVTFGQLSLEQIHYYLDHYQPYDKAGSYGIQEWIGLTGIEKIEGDYFNVMGLPVHRILQELTHFV